MLRRGRRGGDVVVLEGMVFCNEYDEGMETGVRWVGDIPTFFWETRLLLETGT